MNAHTLPTNLAKEDHTITDGHRTKTQQQQIKEKKAEDGKMRRLANVAEPAGDSLVGKG